MQAVIKKYLDKKNIVYSQNQNVEEINVARKENSMKEERMYLMKDYLRYPHIFIEMITEYMKNNNFKITEIITNQTEIFITFEPIEIIQITIGKRRKLPNRNKM